MTEPKGGFTDDRDSVRRSAFRDPRDVEVERAGWRTFAVVLVAGVVLGPALVAISGGSGTEGALAAGLALVLAALATVARLVVAMARDLLGGHVPDLRRLVALIGSLLVFLLSPLVVFAIAGQMTP